MNKLYFIYKIVYKDYWIEEIHIDKNLHYCKFPQKFYKVTPSR